MAWIFRFCYWFYFNLLLVPNNAVCSREKSVYCIWLVHWIKVNIACACRRSIGVLRFLLMWVIRIEIFGSFWNEQQDVVSSRVCWLKEYNTFKSHQYPFFAQSLVISYPSCWEGSVSIQLLSFVQTKIWHIGHLVTQLRVEISTVHMWTIETVTGLLVLFVVIVIIYSSFLYFNSETLLGWYFLLLQQLVPTCTVKWDFKWVGDLNVS